MLLITNIVRVMHGRIDNRPVIALFGVKRVCNYITHKNAIINKNI